MKWRVDSSCGQTSFCFFLQQLVRFQKWNMFHTEFDSRQKRKFQRMTALGDELDESESGDELDCLSHESGF